jgi:transcriptional regulator with XRE-family HTH domain
MTQKALAELAGLSQSYLSQIETGERALDRRHTQVAIAGALNITVAQLLGISVDEAAELDPIRAKAALHVPSLRAVLVGLSAGYREAPTRGRDLLRGEVAQATALRLAADYATLAALLPGLIRDLDGHGNDLGPELVEALFVARATLKAIGYHDLAREAASISVRAAEAHGDPAWRGQAIYSWVVSFPPEQAGLGVDILRRTADGLQGVTSPGAQETYGQVQLMSALQAATVGQRELAWDHIREAGEAAAHFSRDPALGPIGFNGQLFGQANVDVWRVAIAAELGDTSAAVAVQKRIDLSAIPAPNRLVYYWTDLARALAAGKADVAAMSALVRAEDTAPQHFRANPIVRDLYSTVVTRAQRNAITPDMRRLGRSLGLDLL